MIESILPLVALISALTQPGQNKIERLLSMTTNYAQVEKTVMLLKQPNTIVYRVPCISPLQAEDLHRIPVSSSYGRRLHPILNEYKHHSGIDLPGTKNECVYATADGTVSYAGENKTIGKYVRLSHAYGFSTVYGHLSEIKVKTAQHVQIGQVIGLVGSTGCSTGPHLHYGIKKNGKEQNPLPYCYLYLRWLKMLNCEGKNYPTSDRVSYVRSSPCVFSLCDVLSQRNFYTLHPEFRLSRPCELRNIPQAVYS